MSKHSKIKLEFFGIFRFFPENALVFFSGILVSAAINVLTSQIPDSVCSLGAKYIVSACCLLVASAFIIAWAAIIKPIQEAYKTEEKSLEQWYNTIVKDKKSTARTLSIVFIFSIAFTVASAVFFFLI